MEYRLAIIPGDPARENEDYAGVLGHSAVLIDGSGLPGDLPTGCIHGVAWFVRHLGARLLTGMELEHGTPLEEILAEAIDWVTAQHGGTCDLTAPGTPSAVLAIARSRAVAVEYLVLGDCTFAAELPGSETMAVTDHRMDSVAADAFQAMLGVPIGTPEKQAARMDFVRQQLPLRNAPGGYPLAGTKPDAAYAAYTGVLPHLDVKHWVMASDGAARYVEFGLGAWTDVMRLARESGPAFPLSLLRQVERDDALGERWPRAKLHDDAALIYSG